MFQIWLEWLIKNLKSMIETRKYCWSNNFQFSKEGTFLHLVFVFRNLDIIYFSQNYITSQGMFTCLSWWWVFYLLSKYQKLVCIEKEIVFLQWLCETQMTSDFLQREIGIVSTNLNRSFRIQLGFVMSLWGYPIKLLCNPISLHYKYISCAHRGEKQGPFGLNGFVISS